MTQIVRTDSKPARSSEQGTNITMPRFSSREMSESLGLECTVCVQPHRSHRNVFNLTPAAAGSSCSSVIGAPHCRQDGLSASAGSLSLRGDDGGCVICQQAKGVVSKCDVWGVGSRRCTRPSRTTAYRHLPKPRGRSVKPMPVPSSASTIVRTRPIEIGIVGEVLSKIRLRTNSSRRPTWRSELS